MRKLVYKIHVYTFENLARPPYHFDSINIKYLIGYGFFHQC